MMNAGDGEAGCTPAAVAESQEEERSRGEGDTDGAQPAGPVGRARCDPWPVSDSSKGGGA